MTTEPHRPVTGALLRLHWTDTHGVHVNASDEIAKDYCETRDVRRGLRAFARSGTTSAAYEAAANLALARALLVEAGTGRRDGEIDFDVDPVQVHRPRESDLAAASDASGRRAVHRDPCRAPEDGPQSGLSLPIAGFRP
jgi:hypothetical protein